MIKKYYYAFTALAVLATLAFTEPGFLPRFFKTFGTAGIAGADTVTEAVSFFGPVFLAPGLFLDSSNFTCDFNLSASTALK